MRKRNCPHDGLQDGVCGCPEFWEFTAARKTHSELSIDSLSTRNSSATPLASSMFDISNLRSPSPKPSGLPKVTCFFWYHGQCRRGKECHLEHAAHVTWPIIPPPGYTHFASCKLPLCPLREDIVARESIGQKQKGRQISGQLDGTAMSSASRSESSDDSSVSDCDSDTSDDEIYDKHVVPAVNSFVNANSELGSHISKSGNEAAVTVKDALALGTGSLKTFVTPHPSSSVLSTYRAGLLDMSFPPLRPSSQTGYEAAVEPGSRSMDLFRLTNSGSSPISPDGDDYIDLSNIASPPPSSEVGDELGESLSHPGTKRNRRQQDSQWSVEKTGDMKRMDRKHSPGLTHLVSSLDIGQRNTYHPDQVLNSALKPATFNLIKSPCVLEDTPVCFNWYHKGVCKHKHTKCPYKHTFETPVPRVGPPTKAAAGNHGFCALRLCPLRTVPEAEHMHGVEQTGIHRHIAEVSQHSVKEEHSTPAENIMDICNDEAIEVYNHGMGLEFGPIKEKPETRTKYGPSFFGRDPSSSHQDSITGVHSYVEIQGPKSAALKEHSEQPPTLTKSARKQLKTRARRKRKSATRRHQAMLEEELAREKQSTATVGEHEEVSQGLGKREGHEKRLAAWRLARAKQSAATLSSMTEHAEESAHLKKQEKRERKRAIRQPAMRKKKLAQEAQAAATTLFMGEHDGVSARLKNQEKRKKRKVDRRQQAIRKEELAREKQTAVAASCVGEHNEVSTATMGAPMSAYMQSLSDATLHFPGRVGGPPPWYAGTEKEEGQQNVKMAVEAARPPDNDFAYHSVLTIRPGRKDQGVKAQQQKVGFTSYSKSGNFATEMPRGPFSFGLPGGEEGMDWDPDCVRPGFGEKQ